MEEWKRRLSGGFWGEGGIRGGGSDGDQMGKVCEGEFSTTTRKESKDKANMIPRSVKVCVQ